MERLDDEVVTTSEERPCRLSDDDVDELSTDLENNSSAAILVFEHTWFRPLRDAILDSGGVLLEDVHVPESVVDEVLMALEEPGVDTD
ncbi:hypothetical protein E3O55_05330 [Cryobacterium sp. MDB1-18-2]|uniref:hypothetical protein n=1 Tax=unclassified Cryobacterium TaxID=2649013 RepID=UPI00106DAA76|nr:MULTISPECIES: hypothetical protein [unclassified Cryobacterium]TFC32323.1 hypothetical protein E3O55_05330 [Cryobacterium sp. MDB1-18-2]TFC46048.1 hypothetical protein E3O50_01715 [Cryobacterium sp. MDB1-18-1]